MSKVFELNTSVQSDTNFGGAVIWVSVVLAVVAAAVMLVPKAHAGKDGLNAVAPTAVTNVEATNLQQFVQGEPFAVADTGNTDSQASAAK